MDLYVDTEHTAVEKGFNKVQPLMHQHTACQCVDV